jgi:anti-sigma B factor antagonist
MDAMNVSCKKNKSGTLLSVEGDLTIYSVAQAKQELFGDYDNFVSPIALDLRSVSEIDTAGLQLLLFLQQMLSKDNKKIHLEKSNEHVDAVLKNLDVATYFTLDN